MINAERRGEIEGTERVHQLSRWLPNMLPGVLIWLFGKYTFAKMKRAGCAYIEPEDEFVRGFITSFQRERKSIGGQVR